jgi:D-alanine-D-alanine ligase-like ATP-grasp enzyme
MSALRSTEDILGFFAKNQTPLFYASTTAFNVLGAEGWINNLRFITTLDSFDGHHPGAFVPEGARSQLAPSFEAANNYLLEHEAVARYIRSWGPGARILFLMFDERTEELARALGLTVCFPPAALRRHLDSKVVTTRVADAAGVPSVPNVLARVESYEELRRVSRPLGPELVVQLPYGDSGQTTFFISTEEDFRRYAAQIAEQPTVKIMKRIRCRQTTIEACVTRHGILVGPLMTELIGFEELTPFQGGWCGNEVFAHSGSAALSSEIRHQAQKATLAIGERIRQEGHRGYFGLDFLIDQDTGSLYLGEMNPRLTGATLLTNLAAWERREAPLLFFHLLEWLGMDYTLDVERFNETWVQSEGVASFSQLLIEHTSTTREAVARAPPTGVWRLEDDGAVRFLRRDFRPQSIADEAEGLFFRTIDAGQVPSKGTCLGRLLVRGRLMTDGYQLTPRARAWIRGLREQFAP